MARINLLPWRAERRARRQREFMGLMGASAVFAVLLGFLVIGYYDGQIEGQGQRNAYLEGEIKKLDAQIAEIEDLDRKKAQLLMRKQVIEELQASRSQMVHLFDELVRTIPDGLRLTSIKQAGDLLTLEGQSQSNARVSTYMRNIEASGWMRDPELSIIEAKGDDKALPFMFSLQFRMTNPAAAKTEDDELAEGGAP
ncbi:MAG TPA: fimbrial protein [Xanthomonadales bacterium]|nr:fimbrial protein [Xanthomonadales bacterium]